MTKKFGIIAIVIILVGAVVGGIFGRLPVKTLASDGITPERITGDYREALEIVNQNYVGKIDYEKETESSVQAMLSTLDPHSSFFSPEEFRKLYEDQSSRFYGIGVSILQHGSSERNNGVYVQAIVPGTPAEKAGLKYGDRFIEIDGKDARGWTSAEVSKNVRGERGTPVNIKVERPGYEKPLDFRIVRGGVPYPSIRNYFMLRDGIGYVGFTGGFQETSADELDQAIADLKKQGMKQMILDMRGNPGGLLPQAVEVVSRFIPRGQTVVSVKGRSRYAQTQILKTESDKTETFPLVVLINGGSASATEIVSGALQDYGRAVIVGTDSFGKGLVQRVFPLYGGAGLTLTMARYYTPYGRSLQRDYSSGSIYDYYTHHTAADDNSNTATTDNAPPKPQGSPVTTAGGRVYYGGQGITPDIKAPAQPSSNLRNQISEEAFFFVRQLVCGQVAGLENYKVDHQNPNHSLQPDDLQIDDKLLDAFRTFAIKDNGRGLTVKNINSQLNHTKIRIREELVTAYYSSESGLQVLLESDPQVLKSVEILPEAKELWENSEIKTNS